MPTTATTIPSPNLYHLLLTTTHHPKNPTNTLEKLRVPGTYTTLQAAQAAAHRVLYDAGYERSFFHTYEVKAEFFESHHLPDRVGLAVHAEAQDGTLFQVRVAVTPNDEHWEATWEDGRVGGDIFLIVRTRVALEEDEPREHIVEGVKREYGAAAQAARGVLRAAKVEGRWEHYEEAGEGEMDCGYGENVLVHAVGHKGENVAVSVVKGVELESVRLAEASMRIR